MEQVIIKSKIDLQNHFNALKKIRLYVCSSACGKSYLCKKDDYFFDLDAFRVEKENEGHLNYDELTNQRMFQLFEQGKVVLNSPRPEFLDFIHNENIKYVLVYPNPDCKVEYVNRMLKRGSSEEYAKQFGDMVESYYQFLSNDKYASAKIELQQGEYLADYLQRIFNSH